MIGVHLPYKKFGYKSEVEYLKAIPDVVKIYSKGSEPHLICVPDEKSLHIQKMVSKQKPAKHKIRIPPSHVPFCSYSQKRYIPPRLQSSFISKKNLPENLMSEVHPVSQFSTVGSFSAVDTKVPVFQNRSRNNSMNPQTDLNISSFKKQGESLSRCEKTGTNSLSPFHPEAASTSIKDSHFQSYDASRDGPSSTKREKQIPLDFGSSSLDVITKRTSSIEVLGISESVKSNLRKIIERNRQGIWATEFPSIYKEVTGKEFDLHSLGYYDLSSFIDAVPDILVWKYVSGNKKDWLILPMKTLEENESKTSITIPRVPDLLAESVISSIRQILLGYPEGILIKDFLHVYSINCQEPLCLDKLGFKSIDNFLLSIANDVPLTFQTKEGCKRIYLHTEETKAFAMSSFQMDMSLPPEAASPCSEYTLQVLPADVDLNSFFPVYVCSVINPWHMYIQLKDKDCCGAMIKLYDIMEGFYMGPESKLYQIKPEHVKSGIICMALWPVDKHWYRAKVLSVPTQDTVKVFYVDYGTIQVIPQTMLRYIRKDFVGLPTQAIKASLAYVYPLNNKNLWSPRTNERILQLSQNIPLMAKVENIKDGVLSVVLCDTNGDADIFINDILLNEGLAGAEPFVSIPSPAPESQPPNPEQIFNLFLQVCSAYVANMNSNPAGQAVQSPSFNPSTVCTDIFRMFQSSVPQNPAPIPKFSPASGESTTTTNECTSPISNDCCEVFDDDANLIFDEFYQKVSIVTKRYVKRIITGDAYVFHILIYESKPYVSSGDISSLIWGNKESDYLQQRLQNRESNLDSVVLTEDVNPQMFEQFERFHVKGGKKMNNKLCLIAYSLSRVINILNIFGHPSAELRTKILNEIEAFNPHHPKWQELSEAEIPEKEEESYGGTDDDKLNRLCLYDLQAMKEGIRIRRLKLNSTSDLKSLRDEEEKLTQLNYCDNWHCTYSVHLTQDFGVIQGTWNHPMNFVFFYVLVLQSHYMSLYLIVLR
ncbi:tudor domain-containing protein 5 [Nephila pilipes]|uniref:Tudor domain-containing protein 5 n=1 Tax=Nephila pilipes TaxID=299642 RepID=A0A8X6QKK5_NEPPI|nr:tudor domain-containing protein 5 [Nephila pilipes]